MKREDISQAVKCTHWQEFRKDLKGQSTVEKLTALLRYLKADRSCCTPFTREIQVLNYLHALARGGFVGFVTLERLREGSLAIRR